MALALLLVGAAGVAAERPASADSPGLAAESFAGPAASDAGWTVFRDACLTGATAPADGARPGRCTTSVDAPAAGVEPGYLQLTDTASQGALLLDRALPTVAGLQIEFAQYQYGGSGADGIAFVLTDGAAPLTAIGPGGGSLGYAAWGGQLGLPHAYLGLGLDAYGNFSNPDLGGPECARDLGRFSPDSVALRGPGDGTSGYCLLATRRADDVQAGASLRGPAPAAGATDLTAQRRLVRVVVSPTTASQPLPLVTWSVDFSGTGEHFREVGSVRMPVAPPESVKAGFTASVGGLNDVHLIRDLTVRTVEPLTAVELRTGVDGSGGRGTDRTRFTTGDVVPLRFEVVDAGAMALRDVRVDGSRVEDVSCPSTAVAAGSTMTCTGTVTVTEEDARAGALLVTTTVTAANAYGETRSSARTGLPTYTAALTLRATATPAAVTAAGQRVDRSFTVTNAGTVELTDLAVASSAGGPAPSCPVSTLPAGASTTCTGSVTTTQADQEAGSVAGTATASGRVDGRTVRSAEASWSVAATPLPALQLVAAPIGAPLDAPGQRLTVPLLVRNSGNLALTDLVVESAPPGAAPTISCPVTVLDAGASTTCVAELVTAQEDVEAGAIGTTVRAIGRTRAGARVVSADAVASAAVSRSAAIALLGSAAPARVTAAGQPAVLSFTAVNTGTTRLTGLQVDARGASGEPLALSCPATTLDVGGAVTCTATVAAGQDDVDRGGVTASAAASADSTAGPVRSAAATASVAAAAAPGLSLSAAGTPGTDGSGFSFVVRNTGAVTLHGASIELQRFSGTGRAPVVVCSPDADRLAPNAAATCTATYAPTQADVDAGGVRLAAVATASTPSGAGVDSLEAVAATGSPRTAALVLRASVAPSTAAAAGQVVRYAFAVTNQGARTVTGLAVATASGTPSAIRCPRGSLAPGATATCSAAARIPQADVDAGGVRTTAVATAVPSGGDPVSSAAEDVVLRVAARSALTLRVTAAAAARPVAGGVVRYSYAVVNTGGTTLRDVEIDRVGRAGSRTLPEVRCPAGAASLAPGRALRCSARHPITRSDVRAGLIEGTAFALARGPRGTVRSAASGAAVQIPALRATQRAPVSSAPAAVREVAALTLSAEAPAPYRKAGQRLRYAFTVANTGSAPVTGLELQGRSARGGGLSGVRCDTTALQAGGRTRCTASRVVDQHDVDADRASVEVVAVGSSRVGRTASRSATVTTASAGTRRIRLTAAGAGTAARTAVGDVITWTTTVRNSGTRTLRDIVVTVGSGDPLGCPATRLAPGASMVCAAPRQVVRAADVEGGRVVRTATATSGRASAAVTSGPVAAAVRIAAGRDVADTARRSTSGPDLVQALPAIALALLAIAGLAVAAARRRRRA